MTDSYMDSSQVLGLIYDADNKAIKIIIDNNGATGVQGATGVAGVAGATGASITGVTGLTGTTGLIGATGVAGAAGATGTVGITGLTGVTGVQGATGLDVGPNYIGATGIIGLTGVTGVAGIQGVTGAAGAVGATGVAGLTNTGVNGQLLSYASGNALGATGLDFSVSGVITSSNFRITPEGGFAIKSVAKTALVEGNIVTVSTTAGKVSKLAAETAGVMGVVYANANQDAAVWVVIAGIAKVLPAADLTITAGSFVNIGGTAGMADYSASPEADGKQVGMALEASSSAGALTKCLLSFK